MSLTETAKDIAGRLLKMDYVHIYSHHDADGISAAAILGIALNRAGIVFRIRFLPYLKKEDIERPELTLLCDLGASVPDLPEPVMIIDHHVPYARNPYHLNPHLDGMDGDRELSAAGCAYLVAVAMNLDNRDLAGLVMTGIIGDNQILEGMNRKIIGEAIGNNLISPGKGLHMIGRTTKEQLEYATLPYLPGISGNADIAGKIERICLEMPTNETYAKLLFSEIAARSDAAYYSILAVYGDSWNLLREPLRDAHTLTAIIDTCGKSGHADLGFAIASGDAGKEDEAWKITLAFRKHIIENAKSLHEIRPGIYEVPDYDTVSDIADFLALAENKPVIVISNAPEFLKVSARAPQDTEINFEEFMKSAAKTFGGTGGGHRTRAGGELPKECRDAFLQTVPEISA